MKPSNPSWSSGWLAGAHILQSPNFDSRPPQTEISLIVVHSISLPPGHFTGDAVAALFTNTLDCSAHPYFGTLRGLRVSSHFFIRRNGALWQFVSCDQRAWHAGVSEFGGRRNCNDFSVGIELEGLENTPFAAAQYRKLATLCRQIATCYPIEAIAGHEHVAQGRKADPGDKFDWKGLREALDWPANRIAALSQYAR